MGFKTMKNVCVGTALALSAVTHAAYAQSNTSVDIPAVDKAMNTSEESVQKPGVFGIEGLKAVGLGAALVNYSAYRGAASRRTMVLPMPYVEYQGDFLKSDKYGTRGDLFSNKNIEFSISASMSPPVNSKVFEREGMPDLKATVEVGPQLDILLMDGRVDPVNLRVRLPVRQAITIGGKPRNAGLVFSPHINMDVPVQGWNLGFIAGPIFANKTQNAYFYSVDSQYATQNRPAYDAKAGYAGSQFLVSASKKLNSKLWLGAYTRYDTLRGASFADSPLVKTKNYWTSGVALVGLFN